MENLDSEEFILHLQQSLKFVRPNRLRTAVIVRCPYCGDSQKSLNKGHLNIKIDDPRCFLWRCARCGEGGIVNYKFLKDLECIDPTLIEIGLRNNLNAKEYFKDKNKAFRSISFDNQKKIKNIITENSLSEEKLDYISNRLGVEITPKLAEKLKIVTDLYTLLDINNLRQTEDNRMIDLLQEDAVGFLSWDSSMIIFRNIRGEFFGDKRYYNYRVFNADPINTNKFYSIPKKIDVMTPVVKVNMTEGIFDILGLAFTELRDEVKEKDSIMISCNGQSYMNILNILKNMGFINIEVRFFSDRDVSKFKFIKLCNSLEILKHNNSRLFYNKLGKDYGDLRQGIELEEIRM